MACEKAARGRGLMRPGFGRRARLPVWYGGLVWWCEPKTPIALWPQCVSPPLRGENTTSCLGMAAAYGFHPSTLGAWRSQEIEEFCFSELGLLDDAAHRTRRQVTRMH